MVDKTAKPVKAPKPATAKPVAPVTKKAKEAPAPIVPTTRDFTPEEKKALEGHANWITEEPVRQKYLADILAKMRETDGVVEERNPKQKNASIVVVSRGKVVAKATASHKTYNLRILKRPRKA